MPLVPGPANDLTDVAGLTVGNATDRRIRTGVTVVVANEPAVAGVHVMGGAPGTRETDLLAPDKTVERVDALFLSGGSAFGLDAGAGVVARLHAAGRGFPVGDVRVPIVPGAILFDLLNGGEKPWLTGAAVFPPYRELGFHAVEAALRGDPLDLGSVGAGAGATTATLKGGLGSASAVLPNGVTVAALVAVNAVGDAVGEDGRFLAAPFEVGDEFGGRGVTHRLAAEPAMKGLARRFATAPVATTIAVVATDAVLTKAQATRVAVSAHDGFAKALHPAHTPMDGDLVFALATGRRPLADPFLDAVDVGVAAQAVLARAIARGVHLATAEPGDLQPTWAERWG